MLLQNIVRQLSNNDYGQNTLRALGLTTRTSVGSSIVMGVGLVTVGAIVGAGAIVLFANEELRERAREKLEAWRSYLDPSEVLSGHNGVNGKGQRHVA